MSDAGGPNPIEVRAARIVGEAHPCGGYTRRVADWMVSPERQKRPGEPLLLIDIARAIGMEDVEKAFRGRTAPIRNLAAALRELGWTQPKGGRENHNRTWKPPRGPDGKINGPLPFIAPENPTKETNEIRRAGLAGALDEILSRELFKEQIEFFEDTSLRRALFTPRRCGKTTVAAYLLAYHALLYPGRKLLFAGLVGHTAETAVYEAMVAALTLFGAYLPDMYHQQKRIFRLENGSTIRLIGLNVTPSEQEKLCGGGYHGAVIDECQAQNQNLDRVVNEMLGPAMLDFVGMGGGWIVLAGTPGDVMGDHYWWRVTKQDKDGTPAPRERGWKVHSWRVQDNPHMAEQFALECARLREDWGSDDFRLEAGFQRQWEGRWVLELEGRVYRYTQDKNTEVANDVAVAVGRGRDAGPGWVFTFGVDLGWEDATAVAVAAWRPGERKLYFVRSEKRRHATYEQVGDWLTEWAAIYRPVRIVVDQGGIGKQLARSLAARYQLAIVPAGKTDKSDHVARMNADLATSRIQILLGENRDLAREWEELTLDPKKAANGEWAEHPRLENHLCLVAGTQIESAAGPVSIENIQVGQRVATRTGWRRVAAAAQTGIEPTWILSTSDDRRLEGTANHPVWTQRGFVPLASLTQDDTIGTWESMGPPSWSSLTESASVVIPSRRVPSSGSISRASGADAFTARSGKRRMVAMSRVAMTCTTSTKTPSTTIRGTSSSSRGALTLDCTWPILSGERCRRGLSTLLASPPPNGTGRPRGENGTRDSLVNRGRHARSIDAAASSASDRFGARSRRQRSADVLAMRSVVATVVLMTCRETASFAVKPSSSIATQSKSSAGARVLSVAPSGRTVAVFNITVEGEHEYFANGLLTHNCDAALYAWRDAQHYAAPIQHGPARQDDFVAELLRRQKRVDSTNRGGDRTFSRLESASSKRGGRAA